MEPNKLENEIREKLGKREIQPSLQAWDRLDAMLSVQESKVTKESFLWMRIAAGVVFFLGVGYFIFNSNTETTKEDNPNVVVVDNSKSSSNKEIETANKSVIKSSGSIIEEKKSSIVYTESKSSFEKSDQKPERIKNIHGKDVLSINSKENQVAYSDVKNENIRVEEKIEQKIIQENKQVIAEVKTSTEKPKLKIDPNSLLDQVDGEIQLTFRQKVMKTVTKGYKETKEAVASRNQESSINH